MRYIDLDEIILPDGWYSRAEEAKTAVKNGDDPDDKGAIWRELKAPLADLFPEKKCWYCESEVDRADNAVDHFRPKNSVSDAERQHNGYRWLAFEKSNYRYACTFCNSKRKDIKQGTSGGKADRFPIQDESKRAYRESDDYNLESPKLLDPCDPFDWKLLGCKSENGKACSASSEVDEVNRVNASIEIYHLDYGPTTTKRHRTAVSLLSDVEDAKRYFIAAQTTAGRETDFKIAARNIKRAIGRKAPYSGEMIYLLKLERCSQHPWIQDLIDG